MRITSKGQVTIPKAVATRYGIHPGDEIQWEPAGDVIRVVPPGVQPSPLDTPRRLALFDAETARQKKRERRPANDRGWTREELYERGRSS